MYWAGLLGEVILNYITQMLYFKKYNIQIRHHLDILSEDPLTSAIFPAVI